MLKKFEGRVFFFPILRLLNSKIKLIAKIKTMRNQMKNNHFLNLPLLLILMALIILV